MTGFNSDIKAPVGPPPQYSTSNQPPAGHRIACTNKLPPIDQLGPAPFIDGQFPIYLASAIMANGSIQPCKCSPSLTPPTRVPFGGAEIEHAGRFDVLPVSSDMQWVLANDGELPRGRRPVEGGFEAPSGLNQHLYHALAVINRTQVPGKTGLHLRAAHFPYGGQEVVIKKGYSILCWK